MYDGHQLAELEFFLKQQFNIKFSAERALYYISQICDELQNTPQNILNQLRALNGALDLECYICENVCNSMDKLLTCNCKNILHLNSFDSFPNPQILCKLLLVARNGLIFHKTCFKKV